MDIETKKQIVAWSIGAVAFVAWSAWVFLMGICHGESRERKRFISQVPTIFPSEPSTKL